MTTIKIIFKISEQSLEDFLSPTMYFLRSVIILKPFPIWNYSYIGTSCLTRIYFAIKEAKLTKAFYEDKKEK